MLSNGEKTFQALQKKQEKGTEISLPALNMMILQIHIVCHKKLLNHSSEGSLIEVISAVQP